MTSPAACRAIPPGRYCAGHCASSRRAPGLITRGEARAQGRRSGRWREGGVMSDQVTRGSARWFQPADVDPDAAARIFLFPCAGGNAQTYPEWHEMLTLTIPPTRADLAACIDYTDDGARMSCPVVTYTGKDDPLVASGAMASWASRGTAHLGNCEFPGGHFFIYHAALGIATDLTRHIRRTITSPVR